MVATRYVVDAAGPASLGFWRYLLGVGCLGVVFALRPVGRISPVDLLPIALLGVGQFGVLIWLLNWALTTIPAGLASLLFATFPLMTLALAAYLGRERLTTGKVGGLMLALAGVGIAVLGDALDRPTSILGILAALGAALCGAICSVFYGSYAARYSALPVTGWAMFAAVLFFAMLGAGEGLFATWPSFNGVQWSAIAFIGVSSGIGFFLWVFALGGASPSIVTMFLSLSPIVAALGGSAMLGEQLRASGVMGLGLVIGGLVVALKSRSTESA